MKKTQLKSISLPLELISIIDKIPVSEMNISEICKYAIVEELKRRKENCSEKKEPLVVMLKKKAERERCFFEDIERLGS